MRDSVGLLYLDILLRNRGQSYDGMDMCLIKAQYKAISRAPDDACVSAQLGNLDGICARQLIRRDEITSVMRRMRECKDESICSEAARREHTFISRYVGEWLQVNPNDLLDSTKGHFIEKAVAGKSKKDRDSVRKALKEAIEGLKESIEALGEHLQGSIEFRPKFRYNPKDPPNWDFGVS